MLPVIIVCLVWTVGQVSCQLDQTTLNYIGRSLDFRFQVVDNLHNGSDTCQLLFNLTNRGNLIIQGGAWSIYFNKIRGIPDSQFGEGLREQHVRLDAIHGSLYRLTPTRNFFSIPPQGSRVIRFLGTHWMPTRADVMPNAYVTAPGLTPRVIQSTRSETLDFAGAYSTPRQWKRDPDDTYNPMTPRERYDLNRLPDGQDRGSRSRSREDEWRKRVIPLPVRSEFDQSRNMTIDNQWVIVSSGDVIWEANFLGAQLALTRQQNLGRTENVVSLRTGNFNAGDVTSDVRMFNTSEAYLLIADQTTNSIQITGRGPSGVFYGVQTLLMLLDGGRTVPQMRILDAPRFGYRGMHLDVSRNFHRKEEVMRLLGAMSVYKMNTFHFHLTDSEGWRLEIPGLPELTQLGSQRCHDLNENDCLLPELGSGPDTRTSGSGFYTVADYREILAFAQARHIEVIPEFDMPGHSRAAIRSMDRRLRNLNRQGRVLEGRAFSLLDERSSLPDPRGEMFHSVAMNPCIPSTYRFVEHVVDAVVQMHRDTGRLRVFHFGGDEAPAESWDNSLACQSLRRTDVVANVSLARYFANRVARITADRNLELAGWEDGLVHNRTVHDRRELPNREVYAYAWNNHWQWGNHNYSYILANVGYKVVMGQATHLYFDHPYEADPEERGLVWATRFTDTRKVFGFSPLNLYANMDVDWSGDPLNRTEVCGNDGSYCVTLRRPENIIGVQGHLWTELVRTPDQLDYMVFPRFLALAERAWHEASWERLDTGPQRLLEKDRDWNSFIMAVAHREMRRMDQANVQYRIPPLGARGIKSSEFTGQSSEFSGAGEHHAISWRDAKRHPEHSGHFMLDIHRYHMNNCVLAPIRLDGRLLVTNCVYPGLPAQYRLHDSPTWRAVTSDLTLAPNQTIFLRSTSPDGRRFGREIQFEADPAPSVPYVIQRTVDYIAEFLQINLTVIENYNQEVQEQSKVDLVLHNTGNRSIEIGNWQVYLTIQGQLFPPLLVHNPQGHILPEHSLRFTQVKGSLFRFEPVQGFRALRPNERRTVRLVVGMAIAARNYVMPNWYVTAEGMMSRVIDSTRGNVTLFLAPFTNERQWKRSINDRYDPYTLEQRFDMNSQTQDLGATGSHIIPTPVEIQVDERQSIDLSNCCWNVVTDPMFDREAQFLVDRLNLTTLRRSRSRSASRIVELRRGDPAVTVSGRISSSPEAYMLTVDPQREVIEIMARDPAGAFYGVQSLLSLCRGRDGRHTGVVPMATVKDAPRYEHRGMLMEVARNFRSKEEVMKVLEGMASYKLNKLHFHLTDDEGWRLEIPGLPELTQVSSRLCHDLTEQECLLPQLGSGPDNSTSGSGYYSVEDYRDIIRYARDRHIEVIEFFETPGHARSQIVAMAARQRRLRELGDPSADDFLLHDPNDRLRYMSVQMFDDNMMNPCLEATYRFLRHVAQEVQRMRRDIAPMQNYFFVGGEVEDEFVNSTACRARGLDRTGVRQFFVQRMSQIGTDLGIQLSGWADGFMGTNNMPIPRMRNLRYTGTWNNVWEWGRANWSHKLANAGYNVVLAHATHLYLDHPQEPDPEERGLFWAGRYIDMRKMFRYSPDDIFSNVDNTVYGEPINREEFCSQGETTCLPLRNPQNIIGMQGMIFSEMTRTAEQQQELIFPRLLAIAERAWHRASWENITEEDARQRTLHSDWVQFANTLGYKELSYLDRLGLSYRVPPPGARSEGWSWRVNTEYPALTVEVSFNNGVTWHAVQSERVTSSNGGSPIFRTRSAIGTRRSRAVSSCTSLRSSVLVVWIVLLQLTAH